MSDPEESGNWVVLTNYEGQYSLWPAHRASPSGWHATGAQGSEHECVAYIDRIWTDMAPASLRDTLAVRT
ncbi:MAG TPA: MbtH family NRPS accessory protein [Burkholderiaceae bacterium]|nr:MbtH family NRPS accessory protein [Burkholderiaceae bacterium]